MLVSEVFAFVQVGLYQSVSGSYLSFLTISKARPDPVPLKRDRNDLKCHAPFKHCKIGRGVGGTGQGGGTSWWTGKQSENITFPSSTYACGYKQPVSSAQCNTSEDIGIVTGDAEFSIGKVFFLSSFIDKQFIIPGTDTVFEALISYTTLNDIGQVYAWKFRGSFTDKHAGNYPIQQLAITHVLKFVMILSRL